MDTPTILYIQGFRFFFYLNEHEPTHIHVSRGDCTARIVLLSMLDITFNKGFKKKEIRDIIQILTDHHEKIIAAWHLAFKR
ncbi:DUF4160 domain-containing protein [Dyadobacter sandarakinus]|uniref:DUF4160 domain-containing protein n=1 Tax=Dyadobacter sandarakinus TaxID=2747268 RepID=A0ABX7IE28_9BACT|nr:DUF4160 domain-containing protein [Dyadobacter sandarakinus]QRR03672.1 DUF4160 domain-containing protein [Dyadobacter sandarakinus]